MLREAAGEEKAAKRSVQMNFNMKNRIWKKLSVMSMAFFMTGMVLGGCGQTTVYAAEVAYESVGFEEHSETEETGIEELRGRPLL